MYGKIRAITELHGEQVGNQPALEGKQGARLGFSGMISILSGHRSMDGYRVVTKEHTILVLIDNEQSCCESFGYFSTNDNIADFLGAILREVTLTDTALTTKELEETKYLDGGGVQFVNFETSRGTLQLAVYNAHNGYYGHGILVVVDDKIICDNVL